MLVKADFPEKLEFLFQPSRYKVLWGGRGGAKSWGIARALLIKGANQPLRILCAREFQSSIQDSVHRLLADQVEELGLSSFYEVQKSCIKGLNGTEFGFEGIRHNVSKIKSYEGADIAWCEEAQAVSKASWNILIPTIRKDNSEIWISFNPELEEDETYKRFVLNPPRDAKVIKLNHNDNPWFPEVLRLEMEEMRERDPDAYLNVWEGHCRQTLEGAIYAKELRAAQEESRITTVPYDQSKPVHTFWDLGRSDHTAIWFAQVIGFDFRIIDFYQSTAFAIGHYIQELQKRPYIYGVDWMPHDAANKDIRHPLSIEGQMKAMGRNVRIVPRVSVEDGINAARTIFPRCYFDSEKCADGLQALRHYRYEVDKETNQFGKKPLHDGYSDAADGFRYLALALKEPKAKQVKTIEVSRFAHGGNAGWMG